jgi:phosphatidylserine/phosphatidylglycerophosphate/cardiolipin synthase-like enzyme
MKLLVQPENGVDELVKGIDSARKSVEVTVFRFDHRRIENALADAAKRGVFVHAVVARTNSGGEKYLRRLEMRLLDRGITVGRTGNRLARYHDKLMIIDRRELYLMGFNFTYLDVARSRSFGIITKNKRAVQEGVKLFEADAKRQPYIAGLKALVVSPENARKQLASFIRGARKQLLIYDPKISDIPMIHLLQQRLQSGVEVRIIGKVTHNQADFEVRKLANIRLHTRTIVRDRQQAFVGSQSLRGIELDGRREVGLIFRDSKVLGPLIKTFEEDWKTAGGKTRSGRHTGLSAGKAVEHVVEEVSKELPPLAPTIESTIKEVVGSKSEIKLDRKGVETRVQEAVKAVVSKTVKEMMEEVTLSE